MDVQGGLTAKCECFDSMVISLFRIRHVHCGGLLLMRDFLSTWYGFHCAYISDNVVKL